MGRDWLMQMGKGAAENDLKIQYCMPNPRHGLQALEISVVTHVSTSANQFAKIYVKKNNNKIKII